MTIVSSIACALALVAALPAQPATFTNYGSACPGSRGLPRLSNTDFPVLGSAFSVDLRNGNPGAAILLLGTSNPNFPLSAFGAPGCTLLAAPAVQLGTPVNANGDASVAFTVPNNFGLVGGMLNVQYFNADAPANRLGLIATNGGLATFGTALPQLGIQSAALVNPDLLQVEMANPGSEPLNLCARAVDAASGQMTLFLARTIAHNQATGRATVVFDRIVGPANPNPATFMTMRGAGNRAALARTTRLSQPQFSWHWNGQGLVANQAAGTGTIRPAGSRPGCDPAKTFYGAVTVDTVNNCVIVRLPANICTPPSPVYPSGTKVTTDLHWDVVCTGPSEHYDVFLGDVEVLLASGVLGSQVTLEHTDQIRTLLADKYPGRFTVTYDAINNRMVIKLTDPRCRFVRGGGTVHVCCP